MWELDCEESWAVKNWCFWTVVLEKTHESPLDSKEIQPVHPKGNQSWMFIGRTDVEAETPTLWPPDSKNWLIGKDPDTGKEWRQQEKGMTEDEMLGWHHQLNGRELSKLWEVVMDRKVWCAVVLGVAKSQTWLSNWTECVCFNATLSTLSSLPCLHLVSPRPFSTCMPLYCCSANRFIGTIFLTSRYMR